MPKTFPTHPVPCAAGIGLRSIHIAEMLSRRPAAGWLEVHGADQLMHQLTYAGLILATLV